VPCLDKRSSKLPRYQQIRWFLLLFILSLSACRSSGAAYVPSSEGARIDPARVIDATAAVPTATPFQPSSPTPAWTPTPAFTPTPVPSATPLPQTILLFTGVIVPARCVQAGIDARGNADYIFDEVREVISGADLAIGTLNATMSDYPPHTGCIFTYVLVGGSSNADALERAGFDAMSVATNHIKNCGIGDCGDRAFLDTLNNLRRVGIEPIGAGMNLAEAMQPVVKVVNGVRFGFVSLGQIEPMTFAGDDTPGIAVLNDDNLRQAIQAARQVSDVVIAMPHWGPEDSPVPNESQLHFAQVAVEAGADLVMGNHTHVVQALQEINSVQVFYGLGNFVFDQTWDLAHQQGVILKVTFQGTEFAGYELIPTHVDGDGTVHIAGPEEAAQVLERIQSASANLK
jgi:poly-gamma-glutamate capsule biosynthesis protein CapA/YwtB (metallophosphatase superfamily)